MTQPHQIDREAVEDLCARLRRLTPTGISPRVLVNPDGPQAALLIERLAAPMEAVAWREKIDWLRGEHELLSGMVEGEFACSARERAEFEADRAKANAIFDAILALISTHPVQGGEG